MVQELLPLLPSTLTTEQAVLCLLCLLAALFLWLSGSIWSRGIVTLFAVTIGSLLGMYVPRWQMWPVNSMAGAVLGAVGFGLIAYLVERLWMGLTLGSVLACWAAIGAWIQLRPPDYVFPKPDAFATQFMTPPEYVRDLYLRLPSEVLQILPYATATAMLSGVAIAFLWPRLGRAMGMSMLGVTSGVVFALVLVSTQHADWLQSIPTPPTTQAGMLLGLVMVGLLAQWPFLRPRMSREDALPSSALAAPAQPPPSDAMDKKLVRILQSR